MNIVIVHNHQLIVEDLPEALIARRHRVTVFTNPLDGWDYLKAGSDDDALVTRMMFSSDTINGLALARFAKVSMSDRFVLFVGSPTWLEHKKEIGEFLPLSAGTTTIVRFLEKNANNVGGMQKMIQKV